MSEYTTADLVKKVRVCYDEIGVNDSDWENDKDDAELDTIIESKLEEAFEYVFTNASDEVIGSSSIKVSSSTGTQYGETGAYYRVWDSSWLKVMWVRASSWQYAVSDFKYEGEDDAAYLFDPYCGATKDKPDVLIKSMSISGDTKKVIIAVKPGTSGDTIDVGYVGVPSKGSDEKYEMSGRLCSAVVYYVCALVAVTFGEKDRAQEFLEIAMSHMEMTSNTKQG